MEENIIYLISDLNDRGFVELFRVRTIKEFGDGEFRVFMHEKGVLVNLSLYRRTPTSNLRFGHLYVTINAINEVRPRNNGLSTSPDGSKSALVGKYDDVKDMLDDMLYCAVGRPITSCAWLSSNYETNPPLFYEDFVKLNKERLEQCPDWVKQLIIME